MITEQRSHKTKFVRGKFENKRVEFIFCEIFLALNVEKKVIESESILTLLLECRKKKRLAKWERGSEFKLLLRDLSNEFRVNFLTLTLE